MLELQTRSIFRRIEQMENWYVLQEKFPDLLQEIWQDLDTSLEDYRQHVKK